MLRCTATPVAAKGFSRNLRLRDYVMQMRPQQRLEAATPAVPGPIHQPKAMERSKSLELDLTEAEFETLINAVCRPPGGRFAELEFKLRAAWRRAPSQSDYRSAIPDVG